MTAEKIYAKIIQLILEAAAARTPMKSVQGPIMELSEGKIIAVINNVERSFSRIDKLLQLEWKD